MSRSKYNYQISPLLKTAIKTALDVSYWIGTAIIVAATFIGRLVLWLALIIFNIVFNFLVMRLLVNGLLAGIIGAVSRKGKKRRGKSSKKLFTNKRKSGLSKYINRLTSRIKGKLVPKKLTKLHRRLLNKKTRRRLLPALAVVLLFLIGFAIYKSQQAGDVRAGWFNDRWGYRKAYPVNYAGDETLTEYQILIEDVDTASLISAGKMRSDCADLRFTNNNGKKIDHFIVGDTCNTDETQVWVKTDLIDASDITIYMYYGNPNAPDAQNEQATFSYSEEKPVGYVLHSAVNQLEVISLANNNSISHNGSTLNLDRGETGSFSSVSQWTPVTAKDMFNADDASDDTDMLVPVAWAGTEFTVQIRYDSPANFHMIAPWQDATVDIYDDGSSSCTGLSVTSTGATHSCAGTGTYRIESNYPILVFHDPGGDENPLHPTNTSKWIGGGSGSQIVSNENGATYHYTHYATTNEDISGSIGANTATGLSGDGGMGGGAILSWSADNPFGVMQIADGDGGDSHYHQLLSETGTIFGSAVSNTDYISIASDQPANCIVYDTDENELGSGTASSSNDKIYFLGFGTGNSSTWTSEQWYMKCDAPAAVHYQKAGSSESGVWSYPMMRQFTYPTPQVGTAENEEVAPAPIAYWKFDEGQGTTANDSTSNSNDGTISGASWQSEDMCISGKCLSFDGTNDYLSATNTNEFNPENQNFSVCAWIKANTFPDADDTGEDKGTRRRDGIVSKRNSDSAYWQFTTLDDKQIEFYMDDGPTIKNIQTNANYLKENSWYYACASIDRTSATGANLYINGNLVDTDDFTSLGNINNNTNVTIGWEQANNDFFDGFIDEVKIYPYARTADEIKADYIAGATSAGSNAVIGSPPTSGGQFSEGLVGYWKMDESSCGPIDQSGSGNDLSCSNSPSINTGKFGSALEFDGSSSQRAYITDNSSLSVSNVSMSLWAKINATTGNWQVLSWKDTDYEISLNNSLYPRFGIRTNGGRTMCDATSTILNLDTWYFLTLTFDSQEISGYIDGERVINCAHDNPGAIQNTTSQLEIGDASYDFNGLVDEVRIYNRALSPAEVRDLYTWAPGPIGYWKLDDGAGVEAVDSSGFGNVGTLTNSPSWVSGKYGKAVSFDGNDDYIKIAKNNTDFTKVTFENWLKIKDTSIVQTYLGFTGPNAANDSEFFYSIPSAYNGITYHLRDNDNDFSRVTTNITLDENEWYHIATILDFTSSEAKTYINGVLKSTDSIDTDLSELDTSNLWLGVDDESGQGEGYNLYGDIDDVRIYNYARTQSQIIEDMNASHPVGGSPIGSQAVYWKFDEGYGSTAYNAGNLGETHNGTLYNSTPYTNDGKIRKALSFNDSDNYYVQSNNTYNNSGSQTYTAWVYPKDTAGLEGILTTHDHANENNIGVNAYNDKYTISIGYTDGTREYNSKSSNHTITANQWDHVALVFDSEEHSVTLYVNGQYDNSWVLTKTVAFDPEDILVGQWSNTYLNHYKFNGYIDEVKIYSTALTEDQIKTDYNQGKTQVLGSLGTESDGTTPSFSSDRSYCPPGDTTANCGPVAEWKLDEKTGTTAYDTSGNGNNGTLTNMEVEDWKSNALCKFGSCLEFDGSDELVSVSDDSSLKPTTGLTMSAWVRPNNTTQEDYAGIITKDISATSGYSLMVRDSNRVAVNIPNSSWAPATLSDSSIPNQEWSQLVTTYDLNKMTIYINGQLDKQIDADTPITYSGGELRIGAWSSTFRRFNGLIDQVRIYDYALSPAQVAWNYNRGKPVGWWKFDEGEGTTAYDSSGNENNGTLTNMDPATDYVTGKINTALDFDGSNDWIDSISQPPIQTSPNLFTVAGWIKPNNHYSFFLTPASNGYDQWISYQGSNQRIYVMVAESSDTNQRSRPSNDGSVPISKWTHFAVIINNKNIKIYINGKLNQEYNETIDIAGWEGNWRIGQRGNSTNWFNGLMDDFRVYSYELTPQQILQLYNSGSAIHFAGD